MKLRRVLLLLAVTPVVLAAVSWFWLLHTESGARWLWARAQAATDGALSAASVRGDVTSGVELQGIAFVSDSVELAVADVSLTASLEVLPLRVVIDGADSSGFSLRVTERDGSGDGETDLGEILAKLELPFEIAIVRLDMRDAAFEGFAAGRFLSFDAATIAGSWHTVFLVERLQATTPYYDIDGSGRLELSDGNEIEAKVSVDARPALTGLTETVSFDATLAGTISDLQLGAQVADPEAMVTARLAGLGGELPWEVEFDSPALSVPVDGEFAVHRYREGR